jgi:aminocarboxymuconate-semialdehyde decarboxylase
VTVVDVHTHLVPRFFVEEAASRGIFGVREDNGWLVHPEGFRYPIHPEFLDVKAKLAEMDRCRIDISVLSASPTTFFYESPADEVVEFARRSNDALADFIAGEDRLRGLATLPLQAPEAAAAELERAVKELGFLGAQIGTSYANGIPLDGPEFEPVLETASRLEAPLLLHPYYVGAKSGLEDFYLTNSIGNPLDTCVAAARLMHSGLFDRLPGLRPILVHAGGFMPYQLGRLDHAFSVRKEPRTKTEKPPSSYLRRLWFDTITHSDPSLEFLAKLVRQDRLVLGTDLPFDMGDPKPLQRLARVGVDPHTLGTTAIELLRISGRSATQPRGFVRESRGFVRATAPLPGPGLTGS